ncbi:RNA polymerase sigma factor [Stieleria neptunia]|uniref:RNA polymerase sigma factor n=1 Tax=Stieleria neptunia TaxID=2527979 RepID=A0A518HRW9_9BACT|nr:ECF-type sigma factor [Stieleria neptunia]QDV43595.1 RNA polymerase sigma factor [Stieleria neptunia]
MTDSSRAQAPEWRRSIYDQLHRIAEKALRNETPGHSLQPTLLVNDAYLRLLEQKNVDPENRSQVVAAGATIIRRLLVDYARRRKAKKRGGAEGRGVSMSIDQADQKDQIDILDLNDALDKLSRQNPRAARVVELKFFGGLSGDEMASELGVTRVTVQNDWRHARAWLYTELGNESDAGTGTP